MPFSSNREDLLISDFWSSALGEYHLAEAERVVGVGGGPEHGQRKESHPHLMTFCITERCTCLVLILTDFPLTAVCFWLVTLTLGFFICEMEMVVHIL